MYNFAQKTQSIWFIFYASALFLAFIALFEVFNLIYPYAIPLDEALMDSGILFAIGAGFGLGALESGERRLFGKWSLLWLIIFLTGLALTALGIYAEVFSTYPSKVIEPYGIPGLVLYLLGIPFLVYGLILLFTGMSEETRISFGKVWIIYLLFLLIALIAGFAGFGLFFATTGGRTTLGPIPWDQLTEIAIVFGALSIIPIGYVMGSLDSWKEKFHKFWILWAVVSIVGLVLFALSVVEIIGNFDVIGGASHREGGLILGLVFQAPAFVFLIGSTDQEDLIKRLGPIWVIGIIIGLALAFTSQFDTALANSTFGAGLALVIMCSGLVYKAVSVDYSPSAQPTPSSVRAPTGNVAVSSKSGFEVPNDLPIEEKKIYIEMQRKTNENTIVSLNNYGKSNKLSKSFVTRKVQELQTLNAQADDLIASITEEAKRSSRQSLFEQAMGTESQTSQPTRGSGPTPPKTSASMSPPGPPSSPPPPMSPPKSSGPPVPPSPPSAPPSAPPSGPLKPPVSSAPPMPPSSNMPPAPPAVSGPPKPPMPPGMPPSSATPPSPTGFGNPAGGPPKPPGLPPMPSGASPTVPGASQPAKPPGAPSGDAVGTARSTSIAELRGEMLKELRRLRDIFNEDQK